MRSKMQLGGWLLALTTPLLLLGAGGEEPAVATDDGMNLFFRDSGLESLATQELARYPDTDPGDAQILERSFPDAPPQIPHTVEDMFPITLDENECLSCHHPSNAIEKDDVPLPKSHFKVAVMGEGAEDQGMSWVVVRLETADDVAGSRYSCNMCHTAQAGNTVEIGNRFVRIQGKPTQ